MRAKLWPRAARLSIAILALAPGSGQAQVCHANAGVYQDLKTGMSYAQAKAMIGCEGIESEVASAGGKRTVKYMWRAYGRPGANITVTFTDGKLADKARF